MTNNFEGRKRLAQDRLLILEHCWGDQENIADLVEECKSLLDSNEPDNVEICIDILYSRFESYFENGELLRKMSDLIKEYETARLTPEDFIYDGANVKFYNPDGTTGIGVVEAQDDMNDEYEVIEANGQRSGIFSFPAEPDGVEYKIDVNGVLHLLNDDGEAYYSLSILDK